MAVRKQRATTSKINASDRDYNKVVTEAKRLHRSDKEFYIYKSNIYDYYNSVSKSDIKVYNYSKDELEHWIFDETKNRWKTEGERL